MAPSSAQAQSQGRFLAKEDIAIVRWADLEDADGLVRFLGERLSADLALAMPLNEGFVFPVVNFVYVF